MKVNETNETKPRRGRDFRASVKGDSIGQLEARAKEQAAECFGPDVPLELDDTYTIWPRMPGLAARDSKGKYAASITVYPAQDGADSSPRQIDRKYTVTADGNIAKLATGEIIPPDEPLILFRAKDRLAVPMLREYERLCQLDGADVGQLELLSLKIGEFLEYRRAHPDRMKRPGSEPGDDYSRPKA